MKLSIFASIFFLVSCLFISCDKTPDIPNPEEVITTLRYVLTPVGGGTPVVLSFQDLDGDGGDEPVITADTLASNQEYEGALELLNEIEDPAGNISDEVLDEAEDHQFFFSTTVTGLTIDYNDQDADNNPIGLMSQLTTKEAGSGAITIVLRHEPDKAAAGVAGGDISEAGGETDIEVTFDVHVK